jgi:hypothetical protein
MTNSISYFLCYQGKSVYKMSPEEYDTGEFKISYSSETNLVKVDIPKKKEEPHFCEFEPSKKDVHNREKVSIIKVGYDKDGNAIEKEIIKHLVIEELIF